MDSVLIERRLVACTSSRGVAHLPGTHARARLLHSAANRRGLATAHAAARRNRAHMILLHRLPQTCSLLLERRRPPPRTVARRTIEAL
jgi:hypothetical protein